MLSMPMNTWVQPACRAREMKSLILYDSTSTCMMNSITMPSVSRRRMIASKISRHFLLRAKLSSVKK